MRIVLISTVAGFLVGFVLMALANAEEYDLELDGDPGSFGTINELWGTGPTTEGLDGTVEPGDEVFSLYSTEDNKTILSISAKGEVTYGEGVTLDEASKAFWERVASQAPCAAKD